MTSDRYLKSVLTVIAFALTMIALNPWIEPHAAIADDAAGKPVYLVSAPYCPSCVDSSRRAKVVNGELQVRDQH
jgi:hypothetical protein